MFQSHVNNNQVSSAVNLLELIYHGTVRQLRKSHANAVVGLLISVVQSMVMLATFYVMFSILGLRSSAVRGDFMLYIMTGIFLFMTHTKAIGAVSGAEGPTSGMMNHAPMNTVISITSAALSSLYFQILSAIVILTLYYCLVTPFVIDKPYQVFGMFLLAWFSGISIGMIFLALKPWFPTFVGLATSLYSRANMIASGKMFLANTLTPKLLALFSWNPLFHSIDQARGFTFINYTPHNSSMWYTIYLSIALVMIGLMGEFFTRKHASASWSAGR